MPSLQAPEMVGHSVEVKPDRKKHQYSPKVYYNWLYNHKNSAYELNFSLKEVSHNVSSPGVLVVKAGDCHVTQVHVLQVKVDKVLLLPGVHSILVEPE